MFTRTCGFVVRLVDVYSDLWICTRTCVCVLGLVELYLDLWICYNLVVLILVLLPRKPTCSSPTHVLYLILQIWCTKHPSKNHNNTLIVHQTKQELYNVSLKFHLYILAKHETSIVYKYINLLHGLQNFISNSIINTNKITQTRLQ